MSVTSSAEWAKYLGPMAARSLKNLSWKGSKTIATPNARVPRGPGWALDFDMEQSDWYSVWEPL